MLKTDPRLGVGRLRVNLGSSSLGSKDVVLLIFKHLGPLYTLLFEISHCVSYEKTSGNSQVPVRALQAPGGSGLQGEGFVVVAAVFFFKYHRWSGGLPERRARGQCQQRPCSCPVLFWVKAEPAEGNWLRMERDVFNALRKFTVMSQI